MFSIAAICLDSRSIAALLRVSAASEQKRVEPRAHFSDAEQRIAELCPRAPMERPLFVCSGVAHGFQKWNAPSPLSSMLRICTTVRCGGHNDRGWSLCLSCKSRGNFEWLFRPARLACACLPCPVLRSSLPVPTQNRWVGDRLVIKRSFARATFSQATKEKRGGGGGRGGNGGSSYDGNVPFPAVVQFPNHFIAPPRRAGCLSFRSRPCK